MRRLKRTPRTGVRYRLFRSTAVLDEVLEDVLEDVIAKDFNDPDISVENMKKQLKLNN